MKLKINSKGLKPEFYFCQDCGYYLSKNQYAYVAKHNSDHILDKIVCFRDVDIEQFIEAKLTKLEQEIDAEKDMSLNLVGCKLRFKQLIRKIFND